MKRSIQVSGLTVIALLLALPSYSWSYNSTESTTEHSIQLRTGAEFAKKWKCGLKLSVAEELRFDLFDQMNDSIGKAAFNKSYTTLALSYTPIEYVKLDAGYTLRILGKKDLSDPNEYIRHRLFFGITGAYSADFVKLYIRERALCDIRTDSVNLDEKNRYNWLLRSRIGADFSVPGKPFKPYAWVELENTLNVPEFQMRNGLQYVSHIRTQAGVRWRVSRLSSLDFFYRFQYGYDRDINVNSGYYNNKALKLRLTEERSFVHAFGIIYSLNW